MIRAEIVNKGGVPLDFIEAEIADVEKAHGRKVRKAEFVRIGEDNVRERFWWEPVDFERIRRISGSGISQRHMPRGSMYTPSSSRRAVQPR